MKPKDENPNNEPNHDREEAKQKMKDSLDELRKASQGLAAVLKEAAARSNAVYNEAREKWLEDLRRAQRENARAREEKRTGAQEGAEGKSTQEPTGGGSLKA